MVKEFLVEVVDDRDLVFVGSGIVVLHEAADVVELNFKLQGADGLQLPEGCTAQHSHDHHLLTRHYKASLRVLG